MNLRPRSDLLYIKPEVPEYSGSLVIPESHTIEEKPRYGSVVKAGPKCEIVKEGDKVLHTKYEGLEFEFDGETYITLHETDLMAVVG